jgi:2'-5' RNA ligase
MRCFVAAWPDHATRQSLEQLLATLRAQVPAARPMQARNLHLTLAFIGELDSAAATRLAPSIDDLMLQPLDWTVDCLGWFPRARVAWAGGPTNLVLEASVSAVRAQLDALGVVYDRKAFVAHVTLFRDVRAFACSGPLAEPIPWRTEHIALYAAARDERGPVYERAGRTA